MKIIRNLLIAVALIVAGNMCAMDKLRRAENGPLLVEFVKTVDTTVFTHIVTDKKGEFVSIRSADGLTYKYYMLENGAYREVRDTTKDVDKTIAFLGLGENEINFYSLKQPDNGQPNPQPQPAEEDYVPKQGLFDGIKNFSTKTDKFINTPTRKACKWITKKIWQCKAQAEFSRRKKFVTWASRFSTALAVTGIVYAAWTLTYTSSQEDNEDADFDDEPIELADAAETN